MDTMKAIRLHARGGRGLIVYEDAPVPVPSADEVLVRVSAASITPMELSWSATWQTASGAERHRPIPGHEFAGVVAEIGPGVTGVSVGEEVYGLIDFSRDGAEAEYAIALPGELAPKPRSLDFLQAAAVPLSALTAWQALFDHAHLAPHQSVLIHAAAGGVGAFAVQLAHWRGADVIGTASTHNCEFLRSLGANVVIDYRQERFEEIARDVDVVIDTMG